MSAKAGSGNHIVLAVVGDPALRASLLFALQVEGFQVDAFATGEALLTRDPLPGHACLIVDHVVPKIDGIEIARVLRQRGVEFPAILMTAAPHEALRQRARAAGLTLVEKPLFGNALAEAIRAALEIC